MAAHRGGIKTVIIPDDNRKDLVDIPKNITDVIEIRPVRWIDEVLDIALERPLVAVPKQTTEVVTASADSVPAAKGEGEVKSDGTLLKH